MTRKPFDRDLQKFLEPMITSIFWIIIFISPLFFGNYENEIDWTHILRIWKSFIPYLFLFLVNRFLLLPYLFFGRKKIYYFGVVIVLILLLASISQLMEKQDFKHADRLPPTEMHPPHPGAGLPPTDAFRPGHEEGRGRPKPDMPPRQLPPFFSFTLISILIVGFDTGLTLSLQWAKSEQERMNIEKENIETKLAFLRNQVSPHFFMNTLNNIHSLIDEDTEQAKQSIINLSKLMRHLLYDSELEKIPLEKELEFVSNYVDLMRLRFSEKVSISLNLPDKSCEKSIPPLLFTSFLENAFKHGISYQHTSYVNITFSCIPGFLNFEIINSNNQFKSDNEAPGIGVENSIKRLELIYGDAYTLNISENKDEFKVKLSIPL